MSESSQADRTASCSLDQGVYATENEYQKTIKLDQRTDGLTGIFSHTHDGLVHRPSYAVNGKHVEICTNYIEM